MGPLSVYLVAFPVTSDEQLQRAIDAATCERVRDALVRHLGQRRRRGPGAAPGTFIHYGGMTSKSGPHARFHDPIKGHASGNSGATLLGLFLNDPGVRRVLDEPVHVRVAEPASALEALELARRLRPRRHSRDSRNSRARLRRRSSETRSTSAAARAASTRRTWAPGATATARTSSSSSAGSSSTATATGPRPR